MEIKAFLDENGRVKQYPTKRTKKLAVLRYLGEKFERGRSYSEKEVNAILNEWHTFNDPATLRREMFDSYILDRESDGSEYRLSDDPQA